ncbi:MAG TPA: hypothetical protein DCZ03_16320 [Gammaproteobacteria bacterium]|nr:hypothetical protein [Gammaproteobacteria bacterium]
MNLEKTRILVYILAVILYSNVAYSRSLSHNGFLTAGFSQTDNEISFIGVTDEMNFSDLSLIGIQTTFKPSEGPFQFVTQLLARGNQGWDVDAEWAYVGARLTDSFEFQVGKVRAPMFMISETLDVGITYLWIRPPEELYGFNNIPFTTINGLKFKYRNEGQYFDYDLLIYGGENPEETVTSNGLEYLIVLKIAGIEANFVRDNFKLRLSYHDAYDLFLDFAAELAANPTLATLFAGYPNGIIESNSTFSTLGLDYNDGRFLLMAEVGQRKVRENSTNVNWFVTVGYQFGRFLPHLTHSVINITEVETNGTINNEQQSTILGVKISVTPAIVVKAELSHTHVPDIPDDSLAAGLFDALPVLVSFEDDKVNMVNLAINMVF